MAKGNRQRNQSTDLTPTTGNRSPSSISEDNKDNTQLLIAVNELVSIQTKVHEAKVQELKNENLSISSNEKIAMASIEAQKGDRSKQINVYSKLQTQQHILIGIIIVCIFIVIAIAMFTENSKLAMEIIKVIGAAVIAYISYLAGLNKGKLSAEEELTDDD